MIGQLSYNGPTSDITERRFFHHIAPAVMELVLRAGKEMTVVEHKGAAANYSTKVDLDTETFIVAELKRYFPNDQILAEEGHSSTTISADRIWLIDPICGTNNLGKGINNFCTNIALVENAKVVAACVIDHSQGDYFWSVGEGKVFVNADEYIPPSPDLGQKIDIDFGGVRGAAKSIRKRHNHLLYKLTRLYTLQT